ncbi:MULTISPECIES: M23 family metallopeptidase [Leptospira]|uniref:Metalloendopeptidase n=3 Tax=Leptospira borgpetersenii TaxID=174 RepID=A0A0E3B7V7_LEPBO|nr:MULTISPECIES: M23 family metallopeptidase [Leptospira]MBF3374044.1 M23 family metallopeptidase [Leptospira borgpetersenii serovar Arborea]ABJ74781.1 Metalloendopeptidase [Leptospira borgpetersenii serovar Hardjo-bovis str. JB197]ABJ80293.1 Metalloendopeptidase [Leptospira borgpetersenii serovar Hardjo-bovis str. L550]ALO28158.1 metalloendopeptidase [Leptospira borgpetersenii serovar Ballum]AMX59763.1 peptidase [Leptospira borgpetersenii serovar Hardjo]
MDIKATSALIYYRLRYKYQEYKLKLDLKLSELNRKGKERLTVMVIPHSEQKTINFHISYRAISIFIGTVFILLIISSINVLSHSGSVHQLTELNLSNKDFIRQSAKMKEEINSLHEYVEYYYGRLARLYIRLGGDPAKVSKGIGGAEQLSTQPPSIIEPKPINFQTDDLPEGAAVFRLKEDVHNLKISNELTQDIISILKKRKNILKQTPSIWPVKGYVLYPYGSYFNPISGRREYNNGVDIGSFAGSEVLATAPGTVYEIGYTKNTGHFVKVSHKYGWKTIYSNMDRLKVKQGQQVSKTEVIGFVGKTEASPNYMLHYEIHVGTRAINPFAFLNQIQD